MVCLTTDPILTRQQAAAYKQHVLTAYNQNFVETGLQIVMNQALYVLADQGQLVLLATLAEKPAQPLCFELTALAEIAQNNQVPYQNTSALISYLLQKPMLRPGIKAFKQLCVTIQAKLLPYRQSHPYVKSQLNAQVGFDLDLQATTQQALAQSQRDFSQNLVAIKQHQLPYMNQVLQAQVPQATVHVTEPGLFALQVGDQQVAIEVAINQLDFGEDENQPTLPQKTTAGNEALYWAFCRLTVVFDQLYQRALLRDTAVNF